MGSFFVVLLSFGILMSDQSNYEHLFIVLKICTLIILCVRPLFKARLREIYNPVLIVSLIYLLQFGLGSLYLFIYPERYPAYISSYEELSRGLDFIVLCFMLFLCGYYFYDYSKTGKTIMARIANSIPDIHKYDISIKKSSILLITLLSVGWLSRFLIIAMGAYIHTEAGRSSLSVNYTSITQLVYLLSILPIVGLTIVFSLYLTRNKKSYSLLTILLFILEMIYALPTGSKEKILFPVFLLIIIYSVRKKTPYKVILITSFVFIFVLFPTITIYRLLYTGDAFSELTSGFNIYNDLIISESESIVDLIFIQTIGMRLNFAPVVTKIVNYTPEIWDFKMGYTYLTFFISLIPRIIWPGKPGIAIWGNDFGRDYGIISPTDFNTSIGMTWIGEMFINLGWLGIVVAFFYGILYKIIFIYFFKNSKPNILGTILYAFTLYMMIRGNLFALLFSGLLKFYVVLLVVMLPFIRRIKLKNADSSA